MKKKSTPLAEYNGRLFIKFKYTGIHWLVACSDGLSLTFFGEDRHKIPYMQVSDAIAWYEKEIREIGANKFRADMLASLKDIADKFTNGKCDFQ